MTAPINGKTAGEVLQERHDDAPEGSSPWTTSSARWASCRRASASTAPTAIPTPAATRSTGCSTRPQEARAPDGRDGRDDQSHDLRRRAARDLLDLPSRPHHPRDVDRAQRAVRRAQRRSSTTWFRRTRNSRRSRKCSTSTSRRWAARRRLRHPENLRRDGREHRLRRIRRRGQLRDVRRVAQQEGDAHHVQGLPGSRSKLVGRQRHDRLDSRRRARSFRITNWSAANSTAQRFEARSAFPGGDQDRVDNWRIGFRRVIDDKDYLTVQGNGAARVHRRRCISIPTRT